MIIKVINLGTTYAFELFEIIKSIEIKNHWE